VRGSLASCGSQTSRFGGNTMCVEVQCGERIIVFDAGTGMRPLGDDLLARNVKDVDLFLSHFHYDHVCGFPFFRPLFRGDRSVTIWGGGCAGAATTRDTLEALMRQPFFPVGPDVFSARLNYRDLRCDDSVDLSPQIRLRTVALAHPGGALGYRLDFAGKSLCYLCDMEHGANGHDPRLVDFVAGADAVLYDATYTDEEYPEFRGYGHSTWQKGAQLCELARAKKLILCHHRPRRTDASLTAIEKQARSVFKATLAARDGMEFEL
jgi:phosphoribosyl 1,2-cyclic phosphodiesterase